MARAGLVMAVCVGLVGAELATVDFTTIWEYSLSTGLHGFQHSYRMGVDAEGTTFVVGKTGAGIFGETFHGGETDGFVLGVAADGTLVSMEVVGTAKNDGTSCVAFEDDGSRIVAGLTTGALSTQNSEGCYDFFIMRTNTNGHQQFYQFGPDGCEAQGDPSDLAVTKAGKIVVLGITSGQFAGQTAGGGPNGDMFVSMHNANLTLDWAFQIGGSGHTMADAVVVNDAGVIFVIASIDGAFSGFSHQGGRDAYMMSINADGSQGWIVQIATQSHDHCSDLELSPDGAYLVMVGETAGTFPGQTHQGGHLDAFVSKVKVDGTHMWTTQLGTADDYIGKRVVFNNAGEMIIGGWNPANMVVSFVTKVFLINVDVDNGSAKWIWQDIVDTTTFNGLAVDSNDDLIYLGGTHEKLLVRKVSVSNSSTDASAAYRRVSPLLITMMLGCLMSIFSSLSSVQLN